MGVANWHCGKQIWRQVRLLQSDTMVCCVLKKINYKKGHLSDMHVHISMQTDFLSLVVCLKKCWNDMLIFTFYEWRVSVNHQAQFNFFWWVSGTCQRGFLCVTHIQVELEFRTKKTMKRSCCCKSCEEERSSKDMSQCRMFTNICSFSVSTEQSHWWA